MALVLLQLRDATEAALWIQRPVVSVVVVRPSAIVAAEATTTAAAARWGLSATGAHRPSTTAADGSSRRARGASEWGGRTAIVTGPNTAAASGAAHCCRRMCRGSPLPALLLAIVGRIITVGTT